MSTSKTFSYLAKNIDNENLFFKIDTISVNENSEVVSSIFFSDKWKSYDCIALSEKQILNKIPELCLEILGIDYEEFLSIDKDSNEYIENINQFIDGLLDKSLKSGISSFPFTIGKQYDNIKIKIENWISTLDYEYTLNDEVVEKQNSEDEVKQAAPVEAAKR